jgi:transposase
MIAFPSGAKVWIAGGVTDMRCGMNSLALKVQQGLGRDPHGGEIFCFRGRKGDLIKVLWHDGVGMSLYLKRLEAGRFIWPVSQSGAAVPVSAAQLGYLLEGIDWRNPRWTRRRQVSTKWCLDYREFQDRSPSHSKRSDHP